MDPSACGKSCRGSKIKQQTLLKKLVFIDKNSFYFPVFVLVHPCPADVWALVVFFCCCSLSWKMLPKARQPRDKSRAFPGYFGSVWNAALKFREKIYGGGKMNYFRERCFSASGGRGMEE